MYVNYVCVNIWLTILMVMVERIIKTNVIEIECLTLKVFILLSTKYHSR